MGASGFDPTNLPKADPGNKIVAQQTDISPSGKVTTSGGATVGDLKKAGLWANPAQQLGLDLGGDDPKPAEKAQLDLGPAGEDDTKQPAAKPVQNPSNPSRLHKPEWMSEEQWEETGGPEHSERWAAEDAARIAQNQQAGPEAETAKERKLSSGAFTQMPGDPEDLKDGFSSVPGTIDTEFGDTMPGPTDFQKRSLPEELQSSSNTDNSVAWRARKTYQDATGKAGATVFHDEDTKQPSVQSNKESQPVPVGSVGKAAPTAPSVAETIGGDLGRKAGAAGGKAIGTAGGEIAGEFIGDLLLPGVGGVIGEEIGGWAGGKLGESAGGDLGGDLGSKAGKAVGGGDEKETESAQPGQTMHGDGWTAESVEEPNSPRDKSNPQPEPDPTVVPGAPEGSNNPNPGAPKAASGTKDPDPPNKRNGFDWSGVMGSLGASFGWEAGGAAGSSLGRLAGKAAGTLLEGGKIDAGDTLKELGGIAGGAIAGKTGALIGKSITGLFGSGKQEGGGGEGGDTADLGGGSTTVTGGGGGNGDDPTISLLREISINLKSILNDGLTVRNTRKSGSVI